MAASVSHVIYLRLHAILFMVTVLATRLCFAIIILFLILFTYVEHQCILALYCLCYLLRDVGIKADHQQIISFIAVNYIVLHNKIILD